MKQTLTIGVALAALIAASPAIAACPDDIGKVREELRGNQGFQSRYTAGNIDSAAYIRLFDAARTFSDNGMEEQCQAILTGIRTLAQKTAAAQPDRAPAERDRAAMPPAERDRAATPPAQERDQARTMMLRSARPLSEAAISADNLIGADVRNLQDEDLGDVADIVMEGGKITAIVFSRGGFLGIGASYHQVAVEQVKIAMPAEATARGARAANRDDRIVVLDMTADQVKATQKVEKERGRWIAAGSDEGGTPPRAAPAAPPSGGTPESRP